MTLASKTLNSYMFSEIFPNFISVLDWEPSAAKVTKSYSHRLPALERFYLGTTFSLLKLTHSIQNLKTKLKTFPWVSRVPQSKFEANLRVFELSSDKQTAKQTKITTLYILYIYRYAILFLEFSSLIFYLMKSMKSMLNDKIRLKKSCMNVQSLG